MAASEHEVSGTPNLSNTSDTSLRPTPAPPDPPARHGRLGGRLGRWVMAAAVAIVVAALAAVLLGRAGVFTTNSSAGSGGASTSRSWQPYHDSFGLFTLRLPPGWTAHAEPVTGGFGDRHGGVTEREDLVGFDDPAQGTGSAHVSVFATPLQTALAHQTFCRVANNPLALQRFSPLTLRGMEPSGHSLFTTENASFQVNVSIPGVVAARYDPPLVPPTVTPIPATWLATDKSEVNAMLVSFHPTDPKPLTC